MAEDKTTKRRRSGPSYQPMQNDIPHTFEVKYMIDHRRGKEDNSDIRDPRRAHSVLGGE